MFGGGDGGNDDGEGTNLTNINNQIEALENERRQLNRMSGPHGSTGDLRREIEISKQIEFLRATKVQNGISILENAEIKIPRQEIEELEQTGQLDKVLNIYKKSGSEGLKSYIAGRASGFGSGALDGFFPDFSDMAKNPAQAEAQFAKAMEFLKDKPPEFQMGFLEMKGFGELAGALLQGVALTKLFSLAKVGRSFSANDIPNSSSKLISSAEAN
ncbi:hypothetical protein, partial [Leptospira alexanderi]|uniref:hypothetical protein n=1 Tax=Leptospira alexanderi TaxID=100053 RepID=UPI002014FAA6